MAAAAPIRVVYADDSPPYRARLLRRLVAQPGIEVVAVAVDGPAALAAIERHEPDVALVDLGPSEDLGLDVAERVAAHQPPLSTRVVLLAALPIASTRRVLQTVGLGGLVDRSGTEDEILASLTHAAV